MGTAPGPDLTAGPRLRVRVLQLNLCGSGIAGCYTGRSTAEAVAVIGAERPDLVTLNEVCEDDLPVLGAALGEAVTSAFEPVSDRRTGQPWRCRTGQRYGIGMVSRWPAELGSTPDRGGYPTQDGADPEDRVWLCLDLAVPSGAGGPATACTTHLAYTSREVAAAQCRYLFGPVAARQQARPQAGPRAGQRVRRLVVAGDLNLGPGDGELLRSCLPAGSARADDGDRQHVVGTGYTAVGSRPLDLRGSTDHPGLLVTLAGVGG